MAQVKGSVAACAEINAKLTELDKLLEATRAVVASLEEGIIRAVTMQMEQDKTEIEARKGSAQRLLVFNATLIGRSRAEKLTSLVFTKSVHALAEVVKYLGYGTIIRFR